MAGGQTTITYNTDEAEECASCSPRHCCGPRRRCSGSTTSTRATCSNRRCWPRPRRPARHEDRMLGSNTMARMSFDRIAVVTGNDLRVGPDLVDRTVPIRLDPRMPNPKSRQFAVRLDDAQVLARLRYRTHHSSAHRRARVGACRDAARPPQSHRCASSAGGRRCSAGCWSGSALMGSSATSTPSSSRTRRPRRRGSWSARLGEEMPAGGFTTDDVDRGGRRASEVGRRPAVRHRRGDRAGRVQRQATCSRGRGREVKAKVQYRLRDEANKWNGGLRVVREGKVHGEAARWRVERPKVSSPSSPSPDIGEHGEEWPMCLPPSGGNTSAGLVCRAVETRYK